MVKIFISGKLLLSTVKGFINSKSLLSLLLLTANNYVNHKCFY